MFLEGEWRKRCEFQNCIAQSFSWQFVVFGLNGRLPNFFVGLVLAFQMFLNPIQRRHLCCLMCFPQIEHHSRLKKVEIFVNLVILTVQFLVCNALFVWHRKLC